MKKYKSKSLYLHLENFSFLIKQQGMPYRYTLSAFLLSNKTQCVYKSTVRKYFYYHTFFILCNILKLISIISRQLKTSLSWGQQLCAGSTMELVIKSTKLVKNSPKLHRFMNDSKAFNTPSRTNVNLVLVLNNEKIQKLSCLTSAITTATSKVHRIL
jgi:hypothetical protein